MPPVDVSANKMVEKISYRGWKNAYRISNATVELIVLADVGPRIIWYGFVGGDNILHEVAADAGLSGGSEFHLYGGIACGSHRKWSEPTFPITGRCQSLRMVAQFASRLQ